MPVVAVLNILLLSSVTGPFFTKTMVATTQAAHNNNDMIHLAKAPIRRCPKLSARIGLERGGCDSRVHREGFMGVIGQKWSALIRYLDVSNGYLR